VQGYQVVGASYDPGYPKHQEGQGEDEGVDHPGPGTQDTWGPGVLSDLVGKCVFGQDVVRDPARGIGSLDVIQ